MILKSLNPYDVRAWLRACAVCERLLGSKNVDVAGNVTSLPWEAGKAHPF